MDVLGLVLIVTLVIGYMVFVFVRSVYTLLEIEVKERRVCDEEVSDSDGRRGVDGVRQKRREA